MIDKRTDQSDTSERSAERPVERAVTSPVRHPASRVPLLWLSVGVAAAVLFTLIYLIEGVTRPGYNAWQQPISALSLGPGGWLQQVNFVVFGVGTLCLAGAWRMVFGGGITYPLIRGVEGIVAILVAFFSQDPGGYPPGMTVTTPTLHGKIHIVGAFVLVWTIILGFLVIARWFAQRLHWWGWAVYSVLSATLTLVFIALFGMAQQHGGNPGLFERLAVSTEPVWEILLLARLWSGAQPTPLVARAVSRGKR